MNNAAVDIHVQVAMCVYVCHPVQYVPKWGVAGSYGNFTLQPSEGLPGHLPKELHHFIFPPAMHESSSYSKSSPTLVTVCPAGMKQYIFVVFICIPICIRDSCVDQLFMITGHLYVFPEETSIHILCPFLIELFVFLLLS